MKLHFDDCYTDERLALLDEQILANLRDVQLQNGLAPTDTLESGDYTVEMETGTGKTALDAMAPLCTLRYSAAHVNKFNMVYRLDAVDAYEKRLVKQNRRPNT